MRVLQADEGYFFGIGAFETIAVENGKPVFLEQHFMRLMRALDFLKLTVSMQEVRQRAEAALQKPEMKTGRMVLKITVSGRNLVVNTRKNHYSAKDYKRGFSVDYSQVRRNETSAFTYHKTLNYGDCLFEKRRAKEQGIDEPVFLNLKGELCEGATTNLFFVKEGKLITPPVHCGLLPGIMREFVLQTYPVTERNILPQEILECEEMFLTNSLLGVMPVRSFGEHEFSSRKTGDKLLREYFSEVYGGISGI